MSPKSKCQLLDGRVLEYDECIMLPSSPNYIRSFMERHKDLEVIGVGMNNEINGIPVEEPKFSFLFFKRKEKDMDREIIAIELDGTEYTISGELASKLREEIANQAIQNMSDLEKDLIRSTKTFVQETTVLNALHRAYPHMSFRQLRWMYSEIVRGVE